MRYLSSAQAADYLGISRDALNGKIRAGTFPDPDVIIGDRFQGWSPDTVERVRQELKGNRILCNANGAAEQITALRVIAEHVRAYGDHASDPADGVHHTVPAALLVIAARLENEVRKFLVIDRKCARSMARGNTDPALNEITPLPMSFTTVDSVVPPADTDNLARSVRLWQAAEELALIIARIPEVLITRGTRLAISDLGAERDKITAYADRLQLAAATAD